MAECDELYPGYGFESHVGYGTAKHRDAIEQLGVTCEHRLSFAPLAKYIGAQQNIGHSIEGTNKQVGNAAESAAAQWLERRGYTIIERNWKTRFCEIDIIAQTGKSLIFIEVKHRKSRQQGGGLAAITARKLRQMRFAATMYLAHKPAVDAQLAVMTTTGTHDIEVEQLLLIE